MNRTPKIAVGEVCVFCQTAIHQDDEAARHTASGLAAHNRCVPNGLPEEPPRRRVAGAALVPKHLRGSALSAVIANGGDAIRQALGEPDAELTPIAVCIFGGMPTELALQLLTDHGVQPTCHWTAGCAAPTASVAVGYRALPDDADAVQAVLACACTQHAPAMLADCGVRLHTGHGEA